ncbi:MAG: hypothetical protein ACRES7_07675 [Gammaproteobacteria bacterium]
MTLHIPRLGKARSLPTDITDSLLKSEDREFARRVREVFEAQTPAEWACSLVAYENVVSLIRLDRKLPDEAKKMPVHGYSVDRLLRLIEPYMYFGTGREAKACIRHLKHANDQDYRAFLWLVVGHNEEPVGYPTDRGWMLPRAVWNWSALLVMLAEERAEQHPEIQDELASIWICLTKGCTLLPELLKHNVVWTESEKSTFYHILPNKIQYCLNIFMPKILLENPKINDFAASNGLEYSAGSFCPRHG